VARLTNVAIPTSHVVATAAFEDLDVAFRTCASGFVRRSFGLLSSTACACKVLLATLVTVECDVAG
jgi:hypothetical protein